MGAVYIAENADLNKKLAVKLLLPEWSHNEQIVERFLAEARAASAIHHPNIIDIIDASQLPDGSHYMVMEYLEGSSLREFSQGFGAMAIDMALAIIVQICSALDATHMRGIVHRDLKPANLMVSPRPTNQLFTKVLDFGIAKLNDARLSGNIKTGTNAIAGTPSYMSPEQARATRDVDHRSDIYSLGVIMYEMMAGMRPYAADSIGELAYQQATATPTPLSTRRPDLPPGWCDVIQSCIAIDINQRPQDARDLAHRLIAATPNGTKIATAVAPLLFTNAPRSAETFEYQGDYGIGVAPSAPQQAHTGPGNIELASANTMAARNGADPGTPIDTGPQGAADSALGAAHTMSAMPEGAQANSAAGYSAAVHAGTHAYTSPPGAAGPAPTAKPLTTLSSMASETSAKAAPPAKRPAWVIPAVFVAAAAVGGLSFVIAQNAKGDKPDSTAAASDSDDQAETNDAQPVPTTAATTSDAAATHVAVTIDSSPTGATVYVDDVKQKGLTPAVASLKIGGTFAIRVELGRTTARGSLTVTSQSRELKLFLLEGDDIGVHTAPRTAADKPTRTRRSSRSRNRRRADKHRRRPPTSVAKKKPPVTKKKPPVIKKKPPVIKKKPPVDKPFDPDDPAGG